MYLKDKYYISYGFPIFDLIILGMSTDGYIASLFPDSKIIGENEAWVKSDWINKIYSYRVTMTFPVFINVRNRIIALRGKEKFRLFQERKEIREQKYLIQSIYPSVANDYWLVGKI